MKSSFVLLVSFVAIGCVFSQSEELIKARKQYSVLNEAQIRTAVDRNFAFCAAIFRAQELGLRLQGLDYIAQGYEEDAVFFESWIPMAWPELDKDTPNATRAQEYEAYGVDLELTAIYFVDWANTAANITVNITDSEDNLMKEYKKTKDDVMATLAYAVKHFQETKRVFLVFLHQAFNDFYDQQFKAFETTVPTITDVKVRYGTIKAMTDKYQMVLGFRKFFKLKLSTTTHMPTPTHACPHMNAKVPTL